MEPYQKSLRFGIFVILCAVAFRLYLDGVLFRAAGFLTGFTQEVLNTETETGQIVRSFDSPDILFAPESPPPQTEPVPETVPETEPVPVFSPEDLGLTQIRNNTGHDPDAGSLLQCGVSWQTAPEVLILHTHATESYTPAGERYRESSPFRTLNAAYNMVSIGDLTTEILQSEGITVYHDRSLHDYPDYNGAYTHAREAIQEALAEHPGIGLILDIHRDAMDDGSGQLRTRGKVGQRQSAQLMLVVGSDTPARKHALWEQNLALALKLQVLLERENPGITRPILLRPSRYNQDLSPGALLVEVGAAGNTHEEALTAAGALADAVLELLRLP